MKGSRSLLCVFLLAVSGWVHAEQGCPDGFIPNAAGTPGVPCVQGQSNNWGAGTPKAPEVRWADRWGAFASDSQSGAVGSATGLSNRKKAEKAAISHCRSKGGKDCRPLLAYYNQCAAVAWGDGNIQASSAASKEEAANRALGICGKKSSDCEIFFSECSFAERVR